MKPAAAPPKPVIAIAKSLASSEAMPGIILILSAFLAMAAANSPWRYEYHTLFHGSLSWTPVTKLSSLHLWINDALMAVFFFVVGLEIKREVIAGDLADPRRRRLPVLAAAAGMAVPAAFYLLVAGDTEMLRRGWAIPAATDIAFAVGVLALVGKRLPPSLRLFLLTVAIVDDLGAVVIIAVFYTSGIAAPWLLASVAVLGVLVATNRWHRAPIGLFVLLAAGLWYCVLNSGVHATIAGVLAAFCIPMRLGPDHDSMLLRLEHRLVPWNAFLIVPLFGFVNAGVHLGGSGIEGLVDPLPLGVLIGLFAGKQAGISAAIFTAERLGFAPKPAGASWPQVWGVAVLCGIGFTMSLFIAALAFPREPHLVEEAKLGVLAGSLLSATLGYVILRLATRRPAEA